MPSHIKLFEDGEGRQVALFSGTDEANDWLRNCPADEVLSGGWHLLAKEELLSLEMVESQGFLRDSSVGEADTETRADSLTTPNWLMRCANLHSRLMLEAQERGDHSEVARHAEATAGILRELDAEHNRQAAWLQKAIEARLADWENNRDPNTAESIANLCGAIAELNWEEEPEAASKGRTNQRFWLRQALKRQAELSLEAEEEGDLIGALNGAVAVVRLEKNLESL